MINESGLNYLIYASGFYLTEEFPKELETRQECIDYVEQYKTEVYESYGSEKLFEDIEDVSIALQRDMQFKSHSKCIETEAKTMTKDNTYNGWTNWETWKTHLEILDGYEWADAETLKDIVTDVMLDGVVNSTAEDAVLEFIDQVNFEEISEHLKEN